MSEEYLLHLDRAREFFDEGNYEAARAASQYAMRIGMPGDISEARTLEALALRKLEYNDEAFAMFADIVANCPTGDACAEYALMCAERGICDENCRIYAEKGIAESPDNGSGYVALFWYYAGQGAYIEALSSLKRGMHRGAEFSEQRAFELVRGWCQEACNREDYAGALAITSEIVDHLGSFDFLVLHARLAEIANAPRVAVQYYKKALAYLRPGNMRTEILETVARLAI